MTLSPRRRIILLPQDREIIRMLGWSPSQYRYFCEQAQKCSDIRPGDPVNFIFITPAIGTIVLNLAVGAAFTAAAALLAPRLRNQEAPQINVTSDDGQNIIKQNTAAPKAGFGSVQNVVELGSIIPIVYAKREVIDDIPYGGVRVNTNLLWSQIIGNRGNQFFRGVYAIGEGDPDNMEIDPLQIAFGDNLVNSYALTASTGQLAMYARPDGGRITSDDHIQGKDPSRDPGNAENDGGPDVFSAYSMVDDSYQQDFVGATKPSNQTTFGLYSPIGNGLSYRVNPQVKPQWRMNTIVVGGSGDSAPETQIVCTLDSQTLNERSKQGDTFNSYASIQDIEGNSSGTQELTPGETFKYRIRPTTDANFSYDSGNAGDEDLEITCEDAGAAIASRSRQYDSALQEGELYLVGSALCICDFRTPKQFVSNYEGSGNIIEADFTVLETGRAQPQDLNQGPTTGKPIILGSSNSHIFRVAIATIVSERACDQMDISIRSTVGLQINNICAFNSARSNDHADNVACLYSQGAILGPGVTLQSHQYRNDTYTAPEQRYSFWKIGYRVAGTTDDFKYMNQAFGVRGTGRQPIYRSMSIEFPSVGRWEVTFKPMSAWEVRVDPEQKFDDLEVLDPGLDIKFSSDQGLRVRFRGESVSNTAGTFSLRVGESNGSLGWAYAEDVEGRPNYIDAYGQLAELFIYDGIDAGLGGPEHEIVAVSQHIRNEKVPEYDNIALLGANISGGASFPRLDQLSVYVNRGQKGIHTFPEIFRDLLLDTRYGVGGIVAGSQLDEQAILEATTWVFARRYFYDGIISSKVNLRQWATEQGAYHLLDVVIQNGRFSMRPTFYFDRAEPVQAMFTSGNIIEGSFQQTYRTQAQRQLPIVSVRWREERSSGDSGQNGLFPQIQEVRVREAGVDEAGPLIRLDMSDFCTNEAHAIDVAKLQCRVARLVTHDVTFKIVPTEASLTLAGVFALGVESSAYETPQNGCVLSDGTVNSWPPLPDGNYPIVYWDGKSEGLQQSNMSIFLGKTPTNRNIVFSVAAASTDLRHYKVTSLGYDEDGNIDVGAEFFPLVGPTGEEGPVVETTGYSQFAIDWDTEDSWEIER